MAKVFYVIFSILLLTNCTPTINDSEKSLNYSLQKTTFNSPNCQPELDVCLMVSIEYPRFDVGDSLARHLANRVVKNSILDNIGMGDVESTVDPSIEQAVEDLSKSFEELKKEFSDFTTGWQAHIDSRELYQSDSTLVLEISSMTYFGGAHPNSNIRYFNFDRYTGSYLPISTFVSDLKQFTKKAETVFKQTYNIGEGASYDDAGFDFLGNRFVLSANYAFLGDSIRLHYNHYEIASYADGDFEITVRIK